MELFTRGVLGEQRASLVEDGYRLLRVEQFRHRAPRGALFRLPLFDVVAE
jgi:hypothetical protein